METSLILIEFRRDCTTQSYRIGKMGYSQRKPLETNNLR